jgi:type III pantothenate kinase
MLLAIDVSNTHTKVGVYDGDRLARHWRLQTDVDRTADEYGALLLGLFGASGLEPAEITGIIVSSVVPPINQTVDELCRKFFGHHPMFVGPGVRTGMPILYDNPKEVGADRIVNAVAAYERTRGPSIVIDFGTATTFDVVDKSGAYCGGCIAPGINLSMEALHMATAQLPRLQVRHPGNAPVIGTSTVAAMTSGVFWGYVGLIEGLVKRIKAERNEPMIVIGTGGLAPLFAKATPAIEHIDADLTLRGLLLIHQRNK